jgi:hypothetical protein
VGRFELACNQEQGDIDFDETDLSAVVLSSARSLV